MKHQKIFLPHLRSSSYNLLAVFVIITAIFLFIVSHIQLSFQAFKDPESFMDFRNPYFGAINLLHHTDPYFSAEPMKSIGIKYGLQSVVGWTTYAPCVIALFIPLTFLSYPYAKIIWLWLSILALIPCGILIAKITNAPKTYATIAMVAYLLTNCPEILHNLSAGQTNILILLLLSFSFYQLQKNHNWLAGITLGIIPLLKPPLALLFLGLFFQKRFKTITSGFISSFFIICLSSLIWGFNIHLSFLKRAGMIAVSPPVWWSNQSIKATLMRLCSYNEITNPWVHSPELVTCFYILLSAILIIFACYITFKSDRSLFINSLSLWLVTSLLISPQSTDEYLIWLIIPIVNLLFYSLQEKNRILCLVVILDFLALLCFFPLNFANKVAFHHGPLLIFTSIETWGMLVLYGILVWVELSSKKRTLSMT